MAKMKIISPSPAPPSLEKGTSPKKKLIEVALPLDAINREAALRKRKAPAGYPTTLHKWWAQRPLAAARAVIFSQMVDDPSAHPDLFPTEKKQEKERLRLFRIIEDLVLGKTPPTRRCCSRPGMRSGRVGATPAPRMPTIRELGSYSIGTSSPVSSTPSQGAGRCRWRHSGSGSIATPAT
jgi:hypothetical protein